MFDRKKWWKEYYIKNKEKISEYCKQYRKNNKEYIRQYQKDNHEKIFAKEKQRRKETKQFLDDYKLSKGCSICGYNKCAAALVFHHIRGDKKFAISKDISRRLKVIKSEVKKCIVLCANCHRELHDSEKYE